MVSFDFSFFHQLTHYPCHLQKCSKINDKIKKESAISARYLGTFTFTKTKRKEIFASDKRLNINEPKENVFDTDAVNFILNPKNISPVEKMYK